MREIFPIILGQSVAEELHFMDKEILPDRTALFTLAHQLSAKPTDNVRVLIDRPPHITPDGFWEPEDRATLLKPKPTDIYIRPTELAEMHVTAAIGEALRVHPQFGRDYRQFNTYRRRRTAIITVGGVSLGAVVDSIVRGDLPGPLGTFSAITLMCSVIASGANYVHYVNTTLINTAPPPHPSPESTPPIRFINVSE